MAENGDAAVAPAAAASSSSSSSPAPPTQSVWKEYKNKDGRPYWFHTVEQRSVWEKPEEFKTPKEKALGQTRWKEYKSNEKSYYVHSDTKETTWNLPKEVQDLIGETVPEGVSGRATASPALKNSPAPSASPAPTSKPAGPTAGASASGSPAPVAPGPAPGPPPVAPPGLHAGPPRPIYSGPPPGFGPGPPPAGPASTRPPPAGGAPPPSGPAAMSPGPAHTPVPLGPSALSSPSEAFKALLRSKGITASSTWEQTMRLVVTEPLYKVLKSMAERKAAFAEYQAELRKQEDEAKRERREQVKPEVLTVLRDAAKDGKLKEYSSWRAVMKHCGQNQSVTKALEVAGEEDLKAFWEEVKGELKASVESSSREVRHRNMDLLMSLLRTFEADVTTRWRDAHRTILESDEWKSDAHLSGMDVSDMITVFEEYIRDIERDESEKRKREDKERSRAERRHRDEFRKLMEQGRVEGWVHAKATWSEVYHRLKQDRRLTAMLAQKGSTPLDLFFDAVDTCERSVEARTASSEALIRMADPQWEGVRENTTWEQFLEKLQSGLKATGGKDQDRWNAVATEDAELHAVFNELHQASERAARDARRRHERKIRHLIDDARYGLKKGADDALLRQAEDGVAYEEVSKKLDAITCREWRQLDEEILDGKERDEVKRTTWDKFCRRQKEKAEDRARYEASMPPARSRDGMSAEAASSRKRKSEVGLGGGGGSGGVVDDDRERDRSRRREDRDRRRGGREGDLNYGDEEPPHSYSQSRSDRHSSPSSRTKRRRGETPSSSSATAAPKSMVSETGGVADGDDDDKEEGEV